MKRNLYIVAGVAVLLLAAFFAATKFYVRSEKVAQEAVTAPKSGSAPGVLVQPDSPSLGSMMARVTLVEFLDPECESCRAMHPLVKRIMNEHQGGVRLVIRYMPLHRNSVYAASALEAAGEQGRYWDMLDILFQHQPEWGNHHAPKPELIPELAARIGLDTKAFEHSLSKPVHKAKIERDLEDGKKVGVTGTPTFFVNGRRLERLGYDPLKSLINEELSK